MYYLGTVKSLLKGGSQDFEKTYGDTVFLTQLFIPYSEEEKSDVDQLMKELDNLYIHNIDNYMIGPRYSFSILEGSEFSKQSNKNIFTLIIKDMKNPNRRYMDYNNKEIEKKEEEEKKEPDIFDQIKKENPNKQIEEKKPTYSEFIKSFPIELNSDIIHKGINWAQTATALNYISPVFVEKTFKEKEEIDIEKNQSKGQKFSDDKLPIYTVLFKQFPDVIQEVIRCSMAGHKKYSNDTDWINFKRVPNAENQYLNAALRHMTEFGYNEDMKEYGMILHEAQVIWNLMAALQIKLDNSKEKARKVLEDEIIKQNE